MMFRKLVLLAALALLPAASVAAQVVTSARIEGTARDTTNAPLPGVVVTLTSPNLQVPEIVKSTGADGTYQFVELPLGTYKVSFQLEGFTGLTREDILLTSGFAARVDAALKVGGIEESLTVVGDSPLVDLATTRGGANLSAQALASIPNGYTFNDILTLTPGLLPKSSSQAGQIGFPALSGSYNSYGFIGQERNFMDGVNFHSSEGVDFSIAEEVDTKTYGTTAEAPTAGAQISIVVKSGGNDFHGRYRGEFFNDSLSSKNVDDALRAQGIGTGDALLWSNDLIGDLGGRLIRDQLWFYGNIRYQKNERTQSGYAKATGPDGVYGTTDDVPGAPPAVNFETTGKLSYQPSPKSRFTGMYNRGASIEWEALASRFRHRESTSQMHYILHHSKAEWQGTLSNRLLVDVMAGGSWYLANWVDNSTGSQTDPSTLDRATSIETGQMFDTRSSLWRTPSRRQFNASVSYFIGDHELKAGTSVWQLQNVYFAPNLPAGNYQLVFDTVNGVPHQPVQFNAWNRPVSQDVQENMSAAFFSDTWRVSNRLSANLGFRLDRVTASAAATVKEQGPFGNAGTFPRVDAGTWNRPAPRIGMAYDVFGDGKTVAKASYGWYNYDFGDTYATVYSANTQATWQYKWHDLNNDHLYQPGEVDLSTTAGAPDFISISGAVNPIFNADLREPHTNQVSASVERELSSNLSVRGLYVYWRLVDNFQNINPLRPYDAFNIAINRQDPGPDGIAGNGDDGPIVTIYDYDPAFKGSAFVGQSPVNRPAGHDDSAGSFEGTLVKRGGKITGNTTALFTKNHRWLSGVPQSPNDNLYPLDETWAWSYRASGSYAAPRDFQVGISYYLLSGIPGQRTNLFRSLPQSSTATIRMEPFGSMMGPVRQNMDFKLSRPFSIGNNKRLNAAIDFLNVFNSNPIWAYDQKSGPTYNYATTVAVPRTGRVSFTATF